MRAKRFLSICLLLLATIGTLYASDNKRSVEVKIQSGEKWWGLAVDPAGMHLPFEGSFVINTAEFSPTLYKANMLLSTRGRYLWSEKPISVSFDGKKLIVTPAEGESIKIEKSGRSLRESYLMCCHKHFPPQEVGASATLFERPIYEFGGDKALLYTQQDVLDFAAMLDKRGAPSGTILLPIGWNSTSGKMVFDAEVYPDPKGMIEELHKKGMKVMLTVTPYVMAAGRGYQYYRGNNGLLEGADGAPLVFPSRLGYTACRALSPEEIASMREELLLLQKDFGVDGFYFDSLDAIDILSEDSARTEEFIEAWQEASQGFDVAIYSSPVAQQLGSIASSVSPSRNYSWATLGESLERAIDASVLGFSRTSLAADLNFEDENPKLILRTASLAAVLPVAIIPYSVWSLEDTTPLCKILQWRAENGAYILSLAQQGATTAEPIIRHLEYQFPRTGFANCTDEFMIGSKWLVAPVVSGNDVRMVRLPKGKWKDYYNGRTFKGPRVIDVDVSEGKLPLFEKID